jgi:hypothetical protein
MFPTEESKQQRPGDIARNSMGHGVASVLVPARRACMSNHIVSMPKDDQ